MRLCRRGKGLYIIPETKGKDQKHEVHHPGLQGNRGQLCESGRLESQGEFHGHLFRGRADLKQQRRGHCQLLAVGGLRSGDRRRPQKCGYPYPRPVHADRLLCRMVLKTADPGRAGRHQGEDHFLPGETFKRTVQPDGELPWHHAERVGGGPGFFVI